MSQIIVDVPDELPNFRLPEGVQRRLQHLLDQQDRGVALTADERREAEGLVDLAELLSLFKARVELRKREGGMA